MPPIIPNVGTRMKASGKPIDSVSKPCFMRSFVSPKPARNVPMLRLPRATKRLVRTARVRKSGAKAYFGSPVGR